MVVHARTRVVVGCGLLLVVGCCWHAAATDMYEGGIVLVFIGVLSVVISTYLFLLVSVQCFVIKSNRLKIEFRHLVLLYCHN